MTSSATARSPHDHMPRSRSVCDRSPWRRLSVSSTSWGGFALGRVLRADGREVTRSSLVLWVRQEPEDHAGDTRRREYG